MDRKAWWALTIMNLAVGVAVGLHPAQPALGGGPQTKITVKEFVFSPKTITVPSGTDQFVVANTGAAMPLMWAHAEYIKLLRSVLDGQTFDGIPEVAARYRQSAGRTPLDVWQPNRQVRTVKPGHTLRIQAPASFRLHWSRDEWVTVEDTPSSATALGIEYVDIPIPPGQRAPIRFTFFWTADARWEGRDSMVAIA